MTEVKNISRGTTFIGDDCFYPNLNLPKDRETGCHKHSFRHSMLCLAGQIDAQVGNEVVRLGPLDVVDVPAGVFHNAVSREDGSSFVCIWRKDRAEGEGI